MVSTLATPVVDEAAVRAALAEIADPEIPTISIVDLGIVNAVAVETGRVRIELLPTYVGCPALEVIRTAVEDRLAAFGLPIEVRFTNSASWTTERLTRGGRSALRKAGIAPPDEVVRCPYCASADIAMDNLFGPTLCRSLYYCRSCRQPFEAFKPV
jgi:ring-1,2-phenylacetyl-CoA epoxidase subunit PaaD